jgi:hypothetical protein
MESMFRPIFLARWAGCPWFRDAEGKKMLLGDGADARKRLDKFRSQQVRNRRLTAPI